MDDIFIEQMIRRKKDTMYYVKTLVIVLAALAILAGIVSFLLAFPAISFLVPILMAAVVYGAYRLITAMNLEYEYIMTNGELDVDCIINKRRRKRLFSGRAKDFEVMARLDSDEFQEITRMYAGRGRKVAIKPLECTSIPGATGNWFFVSNYKSERVIVFFAPDERILKNLKRYNPRAIKYQPGREQ